MKKSAWTKLQQRSRPFMPPPRGAYPLAAHLRGLFHFRLTGIIIDMRCC